MSKMNPEIKAKWVEALRSGQYIQASGVLRRIDCFCCLGVLCDLASRQGVGRWDDNEEYGINFVTESTAEEAILPGEVLSWMGWSEESTENLWDGYDDPSNCLSILNDRGWSFGRIASYIEENF